MLLYKKLLLMTFGTALLYIYIHVVRRQRFDECNLRHLNSGTKHGKYNSEGLSAVTVKMVCCVTPCNPVEIYQRFGATVLAPSSTLHNFFSGMLAVFFKSNCVANENFKFNRPSRTKLMAPPNHISFPTFSVHVFEFLWV